jgi:glycosyltransferase involved in cell wall biosynthesis
MPGDPKRELAVVVPAKDEAGRIGRVIEAVLEAKLPTEIIVVSDGSTDRTGDVARSFPGVKVVELPKNRGKAAAMSAGVRATASRLVMFIDADLEGLRGIHIDQIALPLLTGECEMCVGVFRGGRKWSDAAMRVSPALSGQRAMRRELFEAVPNIEDLGMGIEMALTMTARRRRARVLHVILRGVSNAHKEKKLGWMKGVAARTKMYLEITEAMVNKDQRRKLERQRKRSRWRGKRG